MVPPTYVSSQDLRLLSQTGITQGQLWRMRNPAEHFRRRAAAKAAKLARRKQRTCK